MGNLHDRTQIGQESAVVWPQQAKKAQILISALRCTPLQRSLKPLYTKQSKTGDRENLQLAWATSALPLSYNNRTTTSPHNPICISGWGEAEYGCFQITDDTNHKQWVLVVLTRCARLTLVDYCREWERGDGAVPKPPTFFVLQFAFSVIHRSGKMATGYSLLQKAESSGWTTATWCNLIKVDITWLVHIEANWLQHQNYIHVMYKTMYFSISQ